MISLNKVSEIRTIRQREVVDTGVATHPIHFVIRGNEDGGFHSDSEASHLFVHQVQFLEAHHFGSQLVGVVVMT